MKQRMVLWGALVVLVAGAVGLVAAIGGGDGDGEGAAPALPLSMGSGEPDAGGGTGEADDARAAAVAPLELGARTTYVPADGLPAGGGTEPAYRLAETVAESAVRELAAALGIDGDPTEQDGTWHVASEGGDMTLDVYEAGASWSAYHTGAPVADGEECVQRGDVTECTVESSASASSGVAAACPTDPAVLCPDPRTPAPERPADLPSEDEARGIALDLLAAAGTDVEGADVQVADGVVQWTVAVEPRVGGLPAPGLAAFVAVGAGGRIESASGYVGAPEELGDYDLVGTSEAIDRLNDGSWGYRTMSNEQGAVAEAQTNTASDTPETTIPAGTASGEEARTLPAPADEPADEPSTTGTVPPTTVVDAGGGASGAAGAGQIAPGEPPPGGPPTPAPEPAPAPDPEPVEVTVTDAEVVLVSVPSWDGTGTYLVPGYRFTADDGSEPVVPAVTDEELAPPPEGQDDPANEPPTTGTVPPTTGTVPPTSTAGGTPAGTEVDLTLGHCGIEPLEVDGQRWVADPPPFDETNAPPEFTRHGTLTIAPGGGSATYTDESGITVGLVPAADDWEPPPCD